MRWLMRSSLTAGAPDVDPAAANEASSAHGCLRQVREGRARASWGVCALGRLGVAPARSVDVVLQVNSKQS